MRRQVSVWILLLALATCATAGTADMPEVTDDEGDAAAPGLSGDILAAWIEGEDAAGFTTVIRLAQFDPVRDRLTDHYFVFEALGERWCTFAYVGPDGAVETTACRWDEETRFQTGDNARSQGSIEPGSPAHVRVRFPFELLGAEDGPVVLGEFIVETFDFKRVTEPQSAPSAGGMVRIDHAEGDATYVARSDAQRDAPAADAPEPVEEAPSDGPISNVTAEVDPPQEPRPTPMTGALAALAAGAAFLRRRAGTSRLTGRRAAGVPTGETRQPR